MEYLLGLDIGATKIRLALAKLTAGNCLVLLKEIKEPTTASLNPADLSRQIINLVKNLEKETGVAKNKIFGLGIGSFGPFSRRRSIYNTANLKAKGIIPLITPLKKHLGIKNICLENDAKSAALAEYLFRKDKFKNIANLIYVTVSTGVGGGAIVEGKPLYGKDGNAMEIGHLTMPVPPEFQDLGIRSRKCGCGRINCLETFASGKSIEEIAKIVFKNVKQEKPAVDAENVFKAARAGDKTSQKIIAGAISSLALITSHLINIFDPQAVFLGGGVAKQGEYLFKPLREKINCLEPLAKNVYLGSSQLGYDIGLIAPFALLLDPKKRYRFKQLF